MFVSQVKSSIICVCGAVLGFWGCWYFVALPNYRQSGNLMVTSMMGDLNTLNMLRKDADPVPLLERSVDRKLGIFVDFHPDHPGKVQMVSRVLSYYEESGKPIPYDLRSVEEDIGRVQENANFPTLWIDHVEVFYSIYWPL